MDTSFTHIRPRFKLEINKPPEAIIGKIQKMLKSPPANIRGTIVGEHIILDIIGEEVHYWSPQLNFRIEADEFNENSSIVAGLIGPRPTVWTLFMFLYFSVGIIGFFLTSYGISKYIIGEFSYLIFALPIAFIIMLTAYQAGKYGESLGSDQIELLKQFVREALK